MVQVVLRGEWCCDEIESTYQVHDVVNPAKRDGRRHIEPKARRRWHVSLRNHWHAVYVNSFSVKTNKEVDDNLKL